MKTKFENFEVLVPDLDGTAVAERVKVMIPLRWDEEVERWLLTPKAHQIIEDTKARHMGLMLPAQFKELRQRHGFTQKEMGELFQVGEKSWTRWESGKQRPSRSINLLIRALYENEISISYLLKRAGMQPRQEESDWTFKAYRAFSEAWLTHSVFSGSSFPDVMYYSKSDNPVLLQCKSSLGKQEFLGHLLKLVHQNLGPAERFFSGEISASRQRFAKPAPDHPYHQPKLTTPTES